MKIHMGKTGRFLLASLAPALALGFLGAPWWVAGLVGGWLGVFWPENFVEIR